MATESSNNSNSEFSLQEQLFNAIQNQYPDAEAKKINKDNFLDIYIPTISPGRGTHLFFNTVKGAIKIGYYTRDENFINKVGSSVSKSIERASNGLRIIGNPKFDDVEDALSSAFEFLSHISNDRPVNTIIEGGKSNEIDSIEDLATKFRDSFSDEEELAEFISSYLDDFSEKGKIVVLQIEDEDLIKSTENHDLLSGDLFTMIGTVDLKSWKPLSKLIGKVESDWVKNEFEEENPASIVLLYCEGNYVYAFSSPSDEFEGLSDEEIEISNELISNYPYDLDESGDKNQIGLYSYDILECSVQELRKDINRRNISNETKVEIIAYNNTLTEFDEDYTLEIDGQEVWLTISRSYNDSYWKSQLDNQELSNLFNCIQEQGFKYGLDEVLYGREFYAPGDSDNSFEIKLKECNEELLPENCFDGGEVNPYFIFDEYECNFEDVDITLRGETERLDIIIDEEYIGSIWSGAYPSK